MEEELTIRTATSRIEQLQNNLDYWLSQKELNYNKTQPSSKPLTGINVSGGQRVDKYLEYVIKDEAIDNKIDLIVDQMKLYESFIEKELARLNKYGEVETQVIYYREMPYYDKTIKKYRSLTWEEIANKVHYSEATCRRIYRKYKKTRTI